MKNFIFLRGIFSENDINLYDMTHNRRVADEARGAHVPPARQILSPMPIAYEPMRENRFILIFPNEFNIPEHMVKSVQRPSWSEGMWNSMEIILYDPIYPSMTQSVYTLIQTEYINNPFTYILQLLDPVGGVIEQWTITGKIMGCFFGDLSYDSNDICKITLIVTPNQDSVILNF